MSDFKHPLYVVNELNPMLPQSQTTDWGFEMLNIKKLHAAGYTGKGVVVGIADTGVHSDHPDLAGAIIKMINTTDEPHSWANGHHTACAGIIGARNNATGVLGVAPDCKIVSVKCMMETGSGSMNQIVNGIQALITEKVHIINLSLGSTSSTPQLEAVIKKALAAGIIVVCAAGNLGRDNAVTYPARYDGVFAVGAINRKKKVSTFSSRGVQVDVSAPGEEVLTTFINGGYATLSGTCFRGDQLVWTTTRGRVPIKDIQVGDMVYSMSLDTFKIESKTVLDVLNKGKRKTYRVKTDGGEVVATSNEPFLTLRDRKWGWVNVSDLVHDDVLLMMSESGTDYNELLGSLMDQQIDKLLDVSFITEIVEEDEEVEVFDLTVEGTHNFVCEGFVVHNSFAAPYVSGVMALLIQAGVKIDIRSVQTTSDDIEDKGFDHKSGWGMIHPEKLLATKQAPPPPAPPPAPKPSASPVKSEELVEKAYECLKLFLNK